MLLGMEILAVAAMELSANFCMAESQLLSAILPVFKWAVAQTLWKILWKLKIKLFSSFLKEMNQLLQKLKTLLMTLMMLMQCTSMMPRHIVES